MRTDVKTAKTKKSPLTLVHKESYYKILRRKNTICCLDSETKRKKKKKGERRDVSGETAVFLLRQKKQQIRLVVSVLREKAKHEADQDTLLS